MAEEKRARSSRAEWAKRVERWQESGLTAEEFASELGLNAGTLKFWKYKLRQGKAKPRREKARAPVSPVSFVEVTPPRELRRTSGVELRLELPNGCRLCVPEGFNEGHLRRVVAALGGHDAAG